MLQKETAAPDIIEMIIELQSCDLLKDFILAGGTALSLQLGHRKSEDIDIFSTNKHDYKKIFEFINTKYKEVEVIYKDEYSLQLLINGIKVDMVSIKGKVLETPKNDDGITLFGLKDISAMKLLAIQSRKEPKDYIDIAYLIEILGLKNMLDSYKEKYDKENIIGTKKALASASHVNPYTWENVKMLKNNIPLSMVKRVIDDALLDYEKKYDNYSNEKQKCFWAKIFSK